LPHAPRLSCLPPFSPTATLIILQPHLLNLYAAAILDEAMEAELEDREQEERPVPCGLEKHLQERLDLNKGAVSKLLAAGAVAVRGAVVRDRAFLVFPEDAADPLAVTVRGHAPPCNTNAAGMPRRAPALWALHKPAGMAVDLSVRAPPGLPRAHRDLHSWLCELSALTAAAGDASAATEGDAAAAAAAAATTTNAAAAAVARVEDAAAASGRASASFAAAAASTNILRPIGRLDRPTSGLLLAQAGHGDLSFAVCVPGALSKAYEATVKCGSAAEPTPAQLQALREGVELADGPAAALDAAVLSRSAKLSPDGAHAKYEARVRVRVAIGRNHIVRRLLAAVGLGVRRLHRVAVGESLGAGLEALGVAEPGMAVRLSAVQVAALWAESGGRAAVRGRKVAALRRRAGGDDGGEGEAAGGGGADGSALQRARLLAWLQQDEEADATATTPSKRKLSAMRQ
jgi:23S rRNA pseudouridine2457 synthase